jgi:ribonuclease VapC
VIVIDTSALVAILRDEPEAEDFASILETGSQFAIPAPCYLEFTMVTSAELGARAWLDRLIEGLECDLAVVDGPAARLASDAFARYGRGSGHPARLNFGDCLSYAVAKRLDAPLLFKGDDFGQTDIRSAVAA